MDLMLRYYPAAPVAGRAPRSGIERYFERAFDRGFDELGLAGQAGRGASSWGRGRPARRRATGGWKPGRPSSPQGGDGSSIAR